MNPWQEYLDNCARKEQLAFQLSNLSDYLPEPYKSYRVLKFAALINSYKGNVTSLYNRYCKNANKFKSFRTLANNLLNEVI